MTRTNQWVTAWLVLLTGVAWPVYAGDWSGSIASETRFFLNDPLYEEQHSHNLSLSFQTEYHHTWEERNEQFVFAPFLRLDQHDPRRTHGDLRELYWHKIAPQWELKLGFKKVFWGVAESQHLVDIINQTDGVEGLASNAKLGQLMLNFTWIQDWGTFDFYVMPLFRERLFAGRHGRFRTPVPIDYGETHYESGACEWHTDLAVRYSHYIGNLDVALSHFSGTSREPRYLARALGIVISPDSPWANLTGARIDSWLIQLLQRIPNARLIPYYDQIEQTGLEAQYILDNWVMKLESIHRSGQASTYTAATLGLEYTFYSLFKSPVDLTAIVEYLWDSRREKALTPFANDLFWGMRLSFNDVQSTLMEGGAYIDLSTGATAFGFEASRRLHEDWRIALKSQFFVNIPSDDIMTTVRKDDYIEAELTWFF